MIKTVATAYFVIMASLGSEQQTLHNTYDTRLECEMAKEQISQTSVTYACVEQTLERTYECGRPIYKESVSWTGRLQKTQVDTGCQQFDVIGGEKHYWPTWLGLGHLTPVTIQTLYD